MSQARRPLDPAVATFAALALTGALYAYLAYTSGPSTLPVLLVAAASVAVALERPPIGLALALLLVPVGTLTGGAVGPFDLPSWLPWSAWIAFMAVIGVARARPQGWRLPPLGFGVILYALAGAVGLLFTEHLGAAAPVVRLLLVGSMLFVAVTLLVRDRSDAEWVLLGIGATLVLLGGLAGFQVLTGASGQQGFITEGGELVGRVDLGFGPNQLGGLIAILLPFAVAGAVMIRRRRAFFVLAVALGVVGIYASFSRSAIIALVVIPLVFMRRRALLALPLLAVVALLAAPDLLTERFATLANGSEIGTRADFWQTSLFIWAQHPVVGTGLGSFPDSYASAQIPGKDFLPTVGLKPPPHAHNLLLNHLAEQGLVGLVALATLLWSALSAALRLRRSVDPWLQTLGHAALASLGVFLIQNQFDVTLVEATGAFFWAILGLLGAVTAIARRQSQALPAPAHG